jgi:hypothetical protein
LTAQAKALQQVAVEAKCTPSRSTLITGRHPICSGTQTVPITGGADGLTRWEITTAQALSEAGRPTLPCAAHPSLRRAPPAIRLWATLKRSLCEMTLW